MGAVECQGRKHHQKVTQHTLTRLLVIEELLTLSLDALVLDKESVCIFDK
jgi:hypothetical protein